MADEAVLSYQIEPTGASSAALAALMNASAVPVPLDILQAAGLRVVSDVTPVADPVVRTITLRWTPSAAPVAAATLDNEGRVSAVSVTSHGLDFTLPPQVSFSGASSRQALARAYLNAQAVAIGSLGSAYSASTFAVVLGGMAPPTYKTLSVPPPDWQAAHGMPPTVRVIPPSCVQNLRIAVEGKGYSTSAVIQFQGTLDPTNPNARPAQAIITSFGPHGEIFGVQITDPGEGYILVPEVVVVDSGQASGGFMVTRPNPITGRALNPNTAGAQYGDATPSTIKNVKANISPVMGVGTPATVAITVVSGSVTGAHVVTAGALYTQVPQVVIIDPAGAGSGATLTARMGLDAIQLLTGGLGYESVPGVVLTPAFEALFPGASDQRDPFWKFMQTALQVGCLSPVTSNPVTLI